MNVCLSSFVAGEVFHGGMDRRVQSQSYVLAGAERHFQTFEMDVL